MAFGSVANVFFILFFNIIMFYTKLKIIIKKKNNQTKETNNKTKMGFRRKFKDTTTEIMAK